MRSAAGHGGNASALWHGRRGGGGALEARRWMHKRQRPSMPVDMVQLTPGSVAVRWNGLARRGSRTHARRGAGVQDAEGGAPALEELRRGAAEPAWVERALCGVNSGKGRAARHGSAREQREKRREKGRGCDATVAPARPKEEPRRRWRTRSQAVAGTRTRRRCCSGTATAGRGSGTRVPADGGAGRRRPQRAEQGKERTLQLGVLRAPRRLRCGAG